MTERRRVSSRDLALAVVRDVFGAQARGAQSAFDFHAVRSELDPRDLAFAAELAYGSIKARRLIDWYLDPYVGERAASLPPTIREVLRLGIYQLRMMDGVDAHAAVYETVNLALRHGHRGTANLVNAVLRGFGRDEPPPPQREAFASENEFLGTRYSLPTWAVDRWRAAFGDDVEAIAAGVLGPPQRAIVANAVRASATDVQSRLTSAGVTSKPSPYVADAFVVTGRAPDAADGAWIVQGEAAAMPVDLLAPQPGERVVEFCSGRGNKTIALASRMGDRGAIESIEIDSRKIAVWRRELERAGVTIAAIVHGDAARIGGEADAGAVLVDAPCSGLGVLGRYPEARWRKSAADAERLAPLQAAMLGAAMRRVRPGGRLVYGVCSTDASEGVRHVEELLRDRSDVARAPLPERYAALATAAGDVLVPPGIEGRDGFYIATLVRSA